MSTEKPYNDSRHDQKDLTYSKMPPKLLYHSPPQLDRERKYSERLMGQDKDREREHTRYFHGSKGLESGKLV